MTIYLAVDIGNVLAEVNYDKFLRPLSKTFNISIEDAKYFMDNNQKLHDLGYIEIGKDIKNHFNVKSEVIIEELLAAWDDMIRPAYRVIEALQEINGMCPIKVALLSNIGIEHAKLFKLQYHYVNYMNFFSPAIKYFSCDVGVRKPSLIYYKSFLQMYPEWNGCLYIDDIQENLDVAKQFGFKTYRFALDEGSLISALKGVILEKDIKNPRWH
jgi:FMN phosphatase YigB (HAD superfamily)